jgi:hypothetical protein
MFRSVLRTPIYLAAGLFWLLFPSGIPAQSVSNRVISEHVRMLLPMEREWLGRDVIVDLESCWRFVNGTTGGNLPRRILVEAVWDDAGVKLDPTGRIHIGMRAPGADLDMKGFLIRNAAREIARMGLQGLSRGASPRAGNELLIEGMSEIIAREYFRTIRKLGGAWVHAQLLDRLNPLGLAAISSASVSGESHDLRTEAPAITFLLTCSELHGRERTLKMFEALRKGSSFEDSIAVSMKTSAAALEAAWLKKVRSYSITESLATSQDDESPRLERIVCLPFADAGGARAQLRLFVRKGANILLPQGLYLFDEAAGKVLLARAPAERGAQYMLIETPIEPGQAPEFINYRVIAVDEGGNVSDWQGSCSLAPR